MPTAVSPTVRRALSLAAAVSLFVDLRDLWTSLADTSPALALVVSAGYLAILVGAVLAVTTRSDRAALRVDVGILVTAIVLRGLEFRPVFASHYAYTVDEGQLGMRAITALLNGADPYSLRFHLPLTGTTPLMGGGTVDTFGYPPLSTLVGALLGEAHASWGTPAVVAGAGLFATAVFCFVVLPRPLKPLATLVVLGLGLLTPYAVSGYTAVVALPFLCLAFWRWTSTGREGRLGARGSTQAVCLGLACATQQLAWFMVPFLVLAIWLVRRGELDGRRSAIVVARYVAVAAGAFLAVNAPFIVLDAGTWAHGVTAVLTQNAVVYGQGFVALSYVAVRHSSTLAFYGYATVLLLLGFLAITAVGIRRVGYALAVLPSAAFVASARSEDNYFFLLVPLWLVAAVCVDEELLAAARPLVWWRSRRTPVLLRTPLAQLGGVLAAVAPAAACVAVAAASAGPLLLRPVSVLVEGTRVGQVTVQATNTSGHPVHPSFSVEPTARIRVQWRQSGPATLAPGQVADYTLSPTTPGEADLTTSPVVYAVSTDPLGLSSARLRLGASGVDVTDRPTRAADAAQQRCLVTLLEGHRNSCGAPVLTP